MILKNDARTAGIGVFIATIAIAICFFCLWAAGRSADTVSVSAASISSDRLSVPGGIPVWETEALDDPYTGVTTNTAMDILDGDNSIVIRRCKGNLKFYINTGKFLGTGGMNTGRAVVRYRFDDGEMVRQTWKISTDNQALIYPGNPAEFLKQFAAAKTLVFNFTPAKAKAQSILYHVSGLPVEFQ